MRKKRMHPHTKQTGCGSNQTTARLFRVILFRHEFSPMSPTEARHQTAAVYHLVKQLETDMKAKDTVGHLQDHKREHRESTRQGDSQKPIKEDGGRSVPVLTGLPPLIPSHKTKRETLCSSNTRQHNHVEQGSPQQHFRWRKITHFPPHRGSCEYCDFSTTHYSYDFTTGVTDKKSVQNLDKI